MSTEVKHTPGPWHFKLKNAGNGFMVIEDDMNICDVFMTNAPFIAQDRARLIAAAPDLLKACEFIIEDLAIGTEGYSLVKLAVKKAKGAL